MAPNKLLSIFVLVMVFVGGYILIIDKNQNIDTEEGGIVGVDSDNNGIRDDIDQFIALRYGTNTMAVKAAQISAKASQRILMTDSSDRVASRVALEESGDAGVCAGRAFDKAGLSSTRELVESYWRTYNSPDRLEHKNKVGASAGQFERSVTNVVCE